MHSRGNTAPAEHTRVINKECNAIKKTQKGRKGREGDALHVVAVATSLREELTRLEMSANALNFNLTVLGLGDKWEGLGSKITYLDAFLRDKPCTDYVLFLGEWCDDDGGVVFVLG